MAFQAIVRTGRKYTRALARVHCTVHIEQNPYTIVFTFYRIGRNNQICVSNLKCCAHYHSIFISISNKYRFSASN